jgi:hypothetical protein
MFLKKLRITGTESQLNIFFKAYETGSVLYVHAPLHLKFLGEEKNNIKMKTLPNFLEIGPEAALLFLCCFLSLSWVDFLKCPPLTKLRENPLKFCMS